MFPFNLSFGLVDILTSPLTLLFGMIASVAGAYLLPIRASLPLGICMASLIIFYQFGQHMISVGEQRCIATLKREWSTASSEAQVVVIDHAAADQQRIAELEQQLAERDKELADREQERANTLNVTLSKECQQCSVPRYWLEGNRK